MLCVPMLTVIPTALQASFSILYACERSSRFCFWLKNNGSSSSLFFINSCISFFNLSFIGNFLNLFVFCSFISICVLFLTSETFKFNISETRNPLFVPSTKSNLFRLLFFAKYSSTCFICCLLCLFNKKGRIYQLTRIFTSS